jgi:hypothetical protein
MVVAAKKKAVGGGKTIDYVTVLIPKSYLVVLKRY